MDRKHNMKHREVKLETLKEAAVRIAREYESIDPSCFFEVEKKPKKKMHHEPSFKVIFHKHMEMKQSQMFDRIIPLAKEISFSDDIEDTIDAMIQEGWKINNSGEIMIQQTATSVLYYLSKKKPTANIPPFVSNFLRTVEIMPGCEFDQDFKKFILTILVIIQSDFFDKENLNNQNYAMLGIFLGAVSYINAFHSTFNWNYLNKDFIKKCLH